MIYNESPHWSLGLLCPFEVHYGWKPNSLKNKLCLDSDLEYDAEEEVLHESHAECECGFPTADDLQTFGYNVVILLPADNSFLFLRQKK